MDNNLLQNMTLEKTNRSPLINFNADSGILEMCGRSIPQAPLEFYQPIIEWVETYVASPAKTTILNVKFEYFNKPTVKSITEIIRKLNKLHEGGKSEVKVNWYYMKDDDDMKESGEDFQCQFKLPMEIFESDLVI